MDPICNRFVWNLNRTNMCVNQTENPPENLPENPPENPPGKNIQKSNLFPKILEPLETPD